MVRPTPALLLLLMLFLTGWLLPLGCLAQRLSGEVRNAESGEPVPYATIGVADRNVGTVADENGRFTLNPAATEAGANVRISCIGFATIQLTLADLRARTGAIRLTPLTRTLPVATVKARKLKRRIIGRDKQGGAAKVSFRLESNEELTDRIGREAGTVLHMPAGTCYLEDLRFYVEANTFRQIKLRLNLYAVRHGRPDSLVVEQDIRFALTDQQTGWVIVDLRPYHLQTDRKDLGLTLQWLSATPNGPDSHFLLPAAFPAIGQKIIYREQSQATWDSFPANLSLCVTAECGK